MPPIVTTLFLAITMIAAFFAPRGRVGSWIGLLTVVGAPTLRMHYVLFAIPAMLELRREIALTAALLVATYTFEGLWLGIGLIVVAYALASRFPILLEPQLVRDRRVETGVDEDTASESEWSTGTDHGDLRLP